MEFYFKVDGRILVRVTFCLIYKIITTQELQDQMNTFYFQRF